MSEAPSVEPPGLEAVLDFAESRTGTYWRELRKRLDKVQIWLQYVYIQSLLNAMTCCIFRCFFL
jgi:hypothetical protein